MALRSVAWAGLVSLVALVGIDLTGASALAADGEVLISQESAATGGVTPGDAPGFPVTLSEPGRYRIAGNLAPEANADGFKITADNVTLDFDGFTLKGSGDGDKGTGIDSVSNSIAIRDGVITGFGLFAIDTHAVGRYWTVSNMRINENGLGVSAGVYARVSGSNISHNNNYGLSCQFCLVEGNVVAENHDDGIDVKGGTVIGNLIAGNRGYGISAFMLAYVLSGYGNNTLVNNNGAGHLSETGHFIAQRPQVNGRLQELQPNVE